MSNSDRLLTLAGNTSEPRNALRQSGADSTLPRLYALLGLTRLQSSLVSHHFPLQHSTRPVSPQKYIVFTQAKAIHSTHGVYGWSHSLLTQTNYRTYPVTFSVVSTGPQAAHLLDSGTSQLDFGALRGALPLLAEAFLLMVNDPRVSDVSWVVALADVKYWDSQYNINRRMCIQDPIFPEQRQERWPSSRSQTDATVFAPKYPNAGLPCNSQTRYPTIAFCSSSSPLRFRERRNRQLLQPIPQSSSLLSLPRPECRCHIGIGILLHFL
jgi:hypothetical protein